MSSFLERKISRRTVLKAAAALPAVLFLKSEADKATTGILHTPYADYYPFYEDHNIGVDLETRGVPDPWDYHWTEAKISPDVSKADFAETMSSAEIGGDEGLRLLDRRGTKIAFADIDVPTYTDRLSDLTNRLRVLYTYKGVDWDSKLHIYGSAIFFVRWKLKLMHAAWRKLTGINLANPDGNPYTEKMMSRAAFLRKMALIPLDIATGYLFLNTLSAGVFTYINPEKADLPVGRDYEKILYRSFIRIHGMLTHARPNDTIAFFRNLVWAEKLSELAESESQRLGRKLNISYQVGIGHGGFEDLLQLGRPFTTNILSLYPSDFWKDISAKVSSDELVNTTIFSRDETSWRHERDFRHNKLALISEQRTE